MNSPRMSTQGKFSKFRIIHEQLSRATVLLQSIIGAIALMSITCHIYSETTVTLLDLLL